MRPLHRCLLRPPARTAALLAAALLATGAVRAADTSPPPDDLAALLAAPVYGGSRLAAASKYEQDAVEAPSIVYVRTGGEIRAQGYRTLAEVLESLPGTHLRQDRAYTYLGVRGVERPGDYSSRLLLLVDGVRVNEAIYDSATAGREFPVDVALIDRVEFIPGPGSVLYGSNAVLGVVNVVTRTPSQLPGTALGLSLGSGARRKVSATWGGDLGGARVLLGVVGEHSHGHDRLHFPAYDQPENNDGWAIGQDGERNQKVFAKARWGELALTALLSERVKDDPTGAYGVIFNTRSASLDRYALADLAYGLHLGPSHELFARVGVAAYAYRGEGWYPGDSGPVMSVTNADARWASGELRYVWSGWSGHRVLAGLEFQHNRDQRLYAADQDPAPFVYVDNRLHSARHSLFVNDEWQLRPGLRLNLGLRADRQLNGELTTSPRAAVWWAASPEWTFKLQRGSAFREPNVSETSYQDSSQVTSADLKVETLRASEATALWRPGRGFEASLSVYRLVLGDAINLIELDDGSQVYANTGGARSNGLELEASRQFDNGLRLRGSWSHQSTRDQASGTDLSDAPRSVSKLMATVPAAWPGSTLGLNLVRLGERVTLAGARLDSYVRLNAQFSLAPPGRRWSIAFGLYNLAGARYDDPAGPEHLQDVIAQDGRQFRIRFGWAL
ncbi:MAG: TonB-dependent receptor [Piscinibacter sp.]|nr:TonB-dependent receptor [Piscinibacter sp.]